MKNLDELYTAIGKKVREIRKRRGLTLEELAEKIGRNWSFLSQIERGKGIPSLETLFLICDVLEISIADLFQKSKLPSYKIDSETDKLIWLLRDKDISQKKTVVNIAKQILKKK
ncbi:MAG: helix-turn-helix transcriptional regulator [Elusimicrobia bacterium]|nr:helix-turn-helix transcriptional regulator [Elusimicrobiota bacterium]